jgi:hypothetical protein
MAFLEAGDLDRDAQIYTGARHRLKALPLTAVGLGVTGLNGFFLFCFLLRVCQ